MSGQFRSTELLGWSYPRISSDLVWSHRVCDPWTYLQWTTVSSTSTALNFFVSYVEGVVESLWSIDHFEFMLTSAYVQYCTLLPGEKQTQREETPTFAHCLWEKESSISAIMLWFFRVQGTNPKLINLQL
jgi:hypothetical protein